MSYVLGADRHRLVAYWGQNAVYNMKKERQYWEKDLVHFCQNSKYDVVVLAFMHVFFDKRQKGLVFSKIKRRQLEATFCQDNITSYPLICLIPN